MSKETNLKRLRLLKGLSQSQLAAASSVNVRMIQHYEQQSKDINTAEAMTLYKLAQALNTNIESLLELDKNIPEA